MQRFQALNSAVCPAIRWMAVMIALASAAQADYPKDSPIADGLARAERAADRIVSIWRTNPERDIDRGGVSLHDFIDYRDQQTSLEAFGLLG